MDAHAQGRSTIWNNQDSVKHNSYCLLFYVKVEETNLAQHGRAPNILIFMVVLMPCGLHDVMSRMLERERYRHWEDHIIFLNYANQLN